MKSIIYISLLILLTSCNINERINNIKARQASEAKTTPTTDFYQAGLNSYLAGNYKDAIADFKKAIAAAPNEAKYYRNLGEALKADGQIKEAIAQMNRAKNLYQNQGDSNAVIQIESQLKVWNEEAN